MNRVRLPDGTLNHFTAASGVEIYRGHRLPQDLRRRSPLRRAGRPHRAPREGGGDRRADAAAQRVSEVRVHPLDRSAVPAGERAQRAGRHAARRRHVYRHHPGRAVRRSGSYLRRKVEQYQLDKQHNWGRIWRITHDGMTPDRQRPRMYSETPAQLVRHLEHPNGWWRDTAQKLLVLKQDKSVVARAARRWPASSGEPARADSCALDARRARARSTPRSRAS